MEDLQAENARLRAELAEAQRIIRVARERLYDADGRTPAEVSHVVRAVRQILRGDAPADERPTTPPGTCARCGAALDNVSPGYSILSGGAQVCAGCIGPNDREALRARGY